jgi:hypothetical protein
MTCGEELAADAEVPEALARLMRHVAENMDAHARWVGATAAPAAARERSGLEAVARAYRDIADASDWAASVMKTMLAVPAAPHDPAELDRAALARWMREKIELQRAFAALLTRHADDSEAALARLAAD